MWPALPAVLSCTTRPAAARPRQLLPLARPVTPASVPACPGVPCSTAVCGLVAPNCSKACNVARLLPLGNQTPPFLAACAATVACALAVGSTTCVVATVGVAGGAWVGCVGCAGCAGCAACAVCVALVALVVCVALAMVLTLTPIKARRCLGKLGGYHTVTTPRLPCYHIQHIPCHMAYLATLLQTCKVTNAINPYGIRVYAIYAIMAGLHGSVRTGGSSTTVAVLPTGMRLYGINPYGTRVYGWKINYQCG